MKRMPLICSLLALLALALTAATHARTTPQRERRLDAPAQAALPNEGVLAAQRPVLPTPAATAPTREDAPSPAHAGFDDLPGLGNTAEGALARVKLGIMRRDKAILRDATTGIDDRQLDALEGDDRFLCVEVVGREARGDDEMVLRVSAPREEAHDLMAVRREEAWRIDANGLWREFILAENERAAEGMLKQLVSTEGVWRVTDSGRAGAQVYWTEDVAAFHCMKDAGGSALKYIDVGMAKADRIGLAAWMSDPPAPRAGYWLRAMLVDEMGMLYAHGPRGRGSNESRYGFCAYPAEYGVTGLDTFIVNQAGVVYQKDLGPQAVEGCDRWPAVDPATAAWKASD